MEATGGPVRFIRQIGVKAKLRIYWDSCRRKDESRVEYGNLCPNSYGRSGSPGSHNATKRLDKKEGVFEWNAFGKEADYLPEAWPTVCDDCGAPVPTGITQALPREQGQEVLLGNHQIFESRLYDTVSGSPEPGDVYWSHYHEAGECIFWDNCDGTHAHCVLPNGHDWDIDSRASNCPLTDDRFHRCWVRHGTLEDGTIHVDKDGHTCAAGGGSIAAPGWHGHLHHGVLHL